MTLGTRKCARGATIGSTLWRQGASVREAVLCIFSHGIVILRNAANKVSDVLIAVSAISSKTLASTGVKSINNLPWVVLDLELGQQNGTVAPTLRGTLAP